MMYSLSILALVSAALASPLHHGGIKNPKAVVGKNFQQWGFLVLENTDFSVAEANPTFKQIQSYKNNRLLTNYNAVSHPSLPNYIATIAGSTQGVADDAPPSKNAFADPTVLDLLEKKGISWKIYAENFPGGCSLAATDGTPHSYAVKHVPALYSTLITQDPKRCANVVEASQFAKDFAAGTLPQWWYYVPTLNNDGHDTNIAFVAAYLQKEWIPRFQDTKFTKDLAMLLTFDEDESHSSSNQVYAALIGDALTPNNKTHVDNTSYNHYSLIKTVEDNWSLGSLKKNDVTALALKI